MRSFANKYNVLFCNRTKTRSIKCVVAECIKWNVEIMWRATPLKRQHASQSGSVSIVTRSRWQSKRAHSHFDHTSRVGFRTYILFFFLSCSLATEAIITSLNQSIVLFHLFVQWCSWSMLSQFLTGHWNPVERMCGECGKRDEDLFLEIYVQNNATPPPA